MTVAYRLKNSLLAGLAAAAALTGYVATRRHAALAATVARSTAHGQHETVTSVLVTGFAATAVIVAVAVFAVTTAISIRRRRRLLAQYYRGDTAARRVYSGHGGYRGGW